MIAPYLRYSQQKGKRSLGKYTFQYTLHSPQQPVNIYWIVQQIIPSVSVCLSVFLSVTVRLCLSLPSLSVSVCLRMSTSFHLSVFVLCSVTVCLFPSVFLCMFVCLLLMYVFVRRMPPKAGLSFMSVFFWFCLFNAGLLCLSLSVCHRLFVFVYT